MEQTKQITVSIEPPCVIITDPNSSVTFHRNLETIREILGLLGSVQWPMKECFVRLMMSADDTRLQKVACILVDTAKGELARPAA